LSGRTAAIRTEILQLKDFMTGYITFNYNKLSLKIEKRLEYKELLNKELKLKG